MESKEWGKIKKKKCYFYLNMEIPQEKASLGPSLFTNLNSIFKQVVWPFAVVYGCVNEINFRLPLFCIYLNIR